MTLSLLLTALLSATAVAISVPLIRRFDDSTDRAAKGMAIYEDQLGEVERDLGAGSISKPDAEAAKAEIAQRLNETAKQTATPQPISPQWRMVALIACVGLVILGGVSLYGLLGSPELPAQTATASADTSGKATNDVDSMIATLRARLQSNPNNAEGWRMLGWALFNTQKFPESADAYARAVELDPANADYKSAYAESLVQAAQGIVTPKAQALINEVLTNQPKEFRARFYDALGHEQAGDQQGALDRWQSLLADAPADAGWRDDVKSRIADLGKALGKDFSADQQAMISGMVQRLADKMKDNPKDLDGWTRLMRAYQVLKQGDRAKEALTTALAAFDGDAETQGKLKAAAAELGIN